MTKFMLLKLIEDHRCDYCEYWYSSKITCESTIEEIIDDIREEKQRHENRHKNNMAGFDRLIATAMLVKQKEENND